MKGKPSKKQIPYEVACVSASKTVRPFSLGTSRSSALRSAAGPFTVPESRSRY
ncbi:MAG TPA: hypothetical protein VK189_08235 [Thermoplasmata archaeon]|nr:hypothetical protein [Thermoplasmata archaeon]